MHMSPTNGDFNYHLIFVSLYDHILGSPTKKGQYSLMGVIDRVPSPYWRLHHGNPKASPIGTRQFSWVERNPQLWPAPGFQRSSKKAGCLAVWHWNHLIPKKKKKRRRKHGLGLAAGPWWQGPWGYKITICCHPHFFPNYFFWLWNYYRIMAKI